MKNCNLDELQKLLRKIFKFNKFHQKFGIHNINNHFREFFEIFITKIIPEELESAFKKFPKEWKKYMYNFIWNFFALFYDNNGNFHSYSREIIDNFEVNDEYFSWINSDQLYFKKDDFFKNYHIEIEELELKLEFNLVYEEPETGGKNKPKRYLILKNSNDSIVINIEKNKNKNKNKDKNKNKNEDKKIKKIRLLFEFRRLKKDEKKKYFRKYQLNICKSIQTEILTKLSELYPNITGKVKKSFENILKNHLKIYTKKRYSGRFIHPNLEKYLNNELKLFIEKKIYKKLFGISQSNKDYSYIKIFIESFRNCAVKIIDMLSRQENIRLFFYKKKKFVISENYCISLKRVPEIFYNEILKNQPQINEWKKLYGLNIKKGNNFKLIKKNPYLVLDTKYFPDRFKYRILDGIENFDLKMGGLLVHSENWQGLNLLKPKFEKSIRTVYIDPPYNTGAGDFIYNDNYLRANWLTMIKNRLELSKSLLKNDGIIFSSIDDNELAGYSFLFENIFAQRLNTIIWHKKTQPSYLSNELISVTEYIIAAKNTEKKLKLMGSFGNKNKLTELINIGNKVSQRVLPKENVIIANGWNGKLKKGKYGKNKLQVELLNQEINIKNGIADQDLNLKSRFKWLQDRIIKEIDKGGIIHIKSVKSLRPTIDRHYKKPIIKAPTTLLSKKVNSLPTNTDANAELKKLFKISPFDYPKPTKLLEYLIRSNTYFKKKGWILDYFSGSGSTAHAVINLNKEDSGLRKYLLIEKEQYFNSVLIPRIKKILYSDNWKDGIPKDRIGISHFMKYISIEQYDDCFWNVKFSENDKINDKNYIKNTRELFYKVDFDNRNNPVSLSIDNFKDPFNYKMKISVNSILKFKKVNLIETFNYLLGINLKKNMFFIHQNKEYKMIIGTKNKKRKNTKINEILILIIWRSVEGLNLEEEKSYLSNKISDLTNFNEIYMNSIVSIKNSKKIEPIFLNLMNNSLKI